MATSYTFTCVGCQKPIVVPETTIGESVNCGSCGEPQVVQDPPLAPGQTYSCYKIVRFCEMNPIWTSYKALPRADENPDKAVFLRIPTMFIRKRLSSLDGLADCLVKSGYLNIPEFPALQDIRIADDEPYFAYEYLRKTRSLVEFKNILPFDISDSLAVIRQLAVALGAAWEKRRLVHQNLKAKNLRLTIDGSLGVRIMNTGISEYILKEPQLLDCGISTWDYRYMSPEFAIDGRGDTPLCDIYAAGGILHMLLTGRSPFEGMSYEAVMQSRAVLEPKRFAHDLPDSMVNLILAMTHREMESRIGSWKEVENAVDAVAAELGVVPKAQAQRKASEKSKRTTADFKPLVPFGEASEVAITIDKSMKEFAKRSMISKRKAQLKGEQPEPKGNRLSNTFVRLMRYRDVIETRRDSAGRLSLYVFGVLCLLVIIVGVSVFVVTSKTRRVEPLQKQTTMQAQGAAPAPALVTAAEAPVAVKAPIPEVKPAADDAKAVAAKKASSFDEAIKEVDAFFRKNTTSYDEAIKQYEEVKLKAVKAENDKVVELINEKVRTVEALKDAQMDVALSGLMAKVTSLVEANESEKAIALLENYEGPYANPTAHARRELIRRIEKGVKIEGGNTLSNVSKGLAVNVLDTELSKIAIPLLKGEVESVKIVLDGLSKRSDLKGLKNVVDTFIANLNAIDELKITDATKADEAIARLDEAKLEGDYLIRGIIYYRAGDLDKAMECFAQVPFNLGAPFTQALLETQAEIALRRVLERNGCATSKDKLLDALAAVPKSPPTLQTARRVISELDSFKEKFKETSFLSENLPAIKAVEDACGKVVDSATIKNMVITATPELSLGKQLADALARTEENAVIVLKKGVYSLNAAPGEGEPAAKPRPADKTAATEFFRVALSGVTIQGEDGVVLENGIEITAQSVSISNIKIKSGALVIQPNKANKLQSGAGNVVIKNCVFDGDVTRLSSSASLVFENCFFRGLLAEGCKGVNLRHCTIVSHPDNLKRNAALWIDGGDTDISDSIIYGSKYGVIFVRKETDMPMPTTKGKILPEQSTPVAVGKDHSADPAKTIKIATSLWYGDEGICAVQYGRQPIADGDVAKTTAKVGRFCRPTMNIYSPPQFLAPKDDNWRLAKGGKGFKSCRDGSDCGMIWR